ncbi:hypothetical protein AB2N04_11555 [Nitratireductor sp. GISD-1A_MAKvit]|uniref:hypothetical protein n=1 Tax=Nitratireductor sp. GISD-1A_MAKvit TaxID=3234198 RepID=UPI003466C497
MTFRKTIRALSAAAAFSITAAVFATGGQATESAISNNAEVEKIVREYLLENPEILLEMQQAP